MTLTPLNASLQRSLWSQHYSSVDALWFVVDSFDQERIAQAKQELWAILNDKKLRKDAMLLVLANKQDLNGALSPDQLQKELDLSTIVDRPWCKLCTSHTCGS